jgi:hypothetical protein
LDLKAVATEESAMSIRAIVTFLSIAMCLTSAKVAPLPAQSPTVTRVVAGTSNVFSRDGLSAGLDFLAVSGRLGEGGRASIGGSFWYSRNSIATFPSNYRHTLGVGVIAELRSTGTVQLFGQLGIHYLRSSVPDFAVLTQPAALPPEDTIGVTKSGLGLSGSIGVAAKVSSSWSVVASVREMHQALVIGGDRWWRIIQLGIQLGR